MVADGDQAIPPDAERQFAARMGATTVEIPTNYVAMVSHPDDVVQLTETAAETVQAANQAHRRGHENRRAWPQPQGHETGFAASADMADGFGRVRWPAIRS
jgi:hypothetical protein